MDMLQSPGTGQKFSSPKPQPAQEQHVSSDSEDRERWQVEWGLLLPGLFVPLFCPQYWDCGEIISLSLTVLFSYSVPYNGTLLTAFDGEVRRKDSWVWIAGGYLRVAGLHALLPTSQDLCGGTRWGWWVRDVWIQQCKEHEQMTQGRRRQEEWWLWWYWVGSGGHNGQEGI